MSTLHSIATLSATIVGLDAELVRVEADITFGLKHFTIVGLPDRAVKEAVGRVEAAMKYAELPFPRFRITVNLAPANVQKQGSGFDAPIAISVLLAQDAIHPVLSLQETVIVGELSLDGILRPMRGILPIAITAKKNGICNLIVPEANAKEASLVNGLHIFAVRTLRDLVDCLSGLGTTATPVQSISHTFPPPLSPFDMQHICGQARAKRAMEVAAAGGHNILLSGPPGSGKTMLARSLAGILPSLSFEEALDITRVHSVSGTLPGHSLVRERPFRAPHHTASGPALIGGGSNPRPGEISLAHRGVLFLDELPEFRKDVLDHLRQPLEDGMVTISRASGSMQFPARFTLVAAMNPCPCGYASDTTRICLCTATQIMRYKKRLSGPLLDRIDLHLDVPKLPVEDFGRRGSGESSKAIQARVQAARERQVGRRGDSQAITNADMRNEDIFRQCRLVPEAESFLISAAKTMQLSARAYMRTVKVAQTIADLAQSDHIQVNHITEALQFRAKLDE